MGRGSKEAGSFQAVQGLFWQQGSGERRAGPRHAYECRQLVAPYNGEALPRQSEFFWVDCKNISSRGFSFFLSQPPEYREVVVALGGAPFIFLLARILYFEVENELYVCGCRFQKRISRALGDDGVDAKQLRAELNRRLLEVTVKQAARSEKTLSRSPTGRSTDRSPEPEALSPKP